MATNLNHHTILLYFIIYHLLRYRRKVTHLNLLHSFPNLTEKERNTIERRYYQHICHLLLEGIYNLYASIGNIINRYKIVNPELLNKYYYQHRSVILLSAHYNNWEYMITSLNRQILHHAVGVGKPLNDKFVANYITRRRARFGTEIVDQTNVRDVMAFYNKHNIACAYMMLADQSPSNTHKCYWTLFLNQETPFLYGPEYFARKYNMPIVYYEVSQPKRGHYTITLSDFCPNPTQQPQYAIVGKYANTLEKLITNQPQYWLWSHKRWKRKRPSDMPLYNQHNTTL